MWLKEPAFWILAFMIGLFVLCLVLQWMNGPLTPEQLAHQQQIQNFIMGYGAGSSGR